VDLKINDLIIIKDYILNELNNYSELRIQNPYKKYEDYLFSKEIKNKHALYFLMKKLFNEELYFFRYPRILPNSKKESNVKDNYELLKQFIIENGKIVDKDYLYDYFMNEYCWSKENITNNISINENLIESNNKVKYINYKKHITKKESDYIKEFILSELKKDDDIYINLDDNFIKKIDTNHDITTILNILRKSKMFLVLGHKNDMKIILLKENKYDISKNVELITYIISKHFGDIVDSSLLTDYLSKIGFVDEELPNYYKSNKDDFPFIYFDQTFVIK
jgi:ribosomal protein S18